MEPVRLEFLVNSTRAWNRGIRSLTISHKVQKPEVSPDATHQNGNVISTVN